MLMKRLDLRTSHTTKASITLGVFLKPAEPDQKTGLNWLFFPVSHKTGPVQFDRIKIFNFGLVPGLENLHTEPDQTVFMYVQKIMLGLGLELKTQGLT